MKIANFVLFLSSNVSGGRPKCQKITKKFLVVALVLLKWPILTYNSKTFPPNLLHPLRQLHTKHNIVVNCFFCKKSFFLSLVICSFTILLSDRYFFICFTKTTFTLFWGETVKHWLLALEKALIETIFLSKKYGRMRRKFFFFPVKFTKVAKILLT